MRKGMQGRHGGPVLGGVIAEATAGAGNVLQPRSQWEADRQAQRGGVETPHALESKYPKVGHTWGRFWMFPSPQLLHSLPGQKQNFSIKTARSPRGICASSY